MHLSTSCFKRLILVALFILASFGQLSALRTTQLISPTNNSECVQLINPVFTWHKITGATVYQFSLSQNSDMSSPVVTYSPTDTSYTVQVDLFSGGATYYWQVLATIPQGGLNPPIFDSSAIWSFKTQNYAPFLSVPDNNGTCQPLNVIFKWTSVETATYQIQIANTSSFTPPFVADISNVAVTTDTIKVPNYSTRYYWRVRAVMPTGCTTEWATSRYFSTSRKPPALVAPANNATSVSFFAPLHWTAEGNPTSHRLQIANDSLFPTGSVIYDNFPNSTYDTVQLSQSNTTYYWRVKTSYTDCESDWSNYYAFTTIYAKTTVVLPFMDLMCAPFTQRFEWTSLFGVRAYQLQIAEWPQQLTEPSFSSPYLLLDTSNIRNNFDTITVKKGLTKFVWRVRANDQFNTGEWSDTGNFKTTINYPERIFPFNGKDSLPLTITFKWKTLNLGETYKIQISKSTDFSMPLVNKSIAFSDTFRFTADDFFVTYYWRITSSYFNCSNAPWSNIWTFRTVLPVPNLIAPPDNSTRQALNITFNWDIPEGSKSFTFQLSKSPAFDVLVVGKNGWTSSSLNVTKELEPSTTYYWRVNATNAKGTSFWSNTFKFTTGGLGPEVPILTSPSNGTTDMPTNVTLSWQTAARAKLYNLQVADNDQFLKPDVNLENITATNFDLPQLKNNKTYFWHVAAISDSGRSGWSQLWSFSTTILPPSDAPFQNYPGNNISDVPTALTFAWDPVDRAASYHIQVTDNADFTPPIIIDDSLLIQSSKYFSGLGFNKTYSWRVRAINTAGYGPWSEIWKFKSIITSVNENIGTANIKVNILPNPFNDLATIKFSLPDDYFISVKLYNILGAELKTLTNEFYYAGDYEILLVGKNLENGIYLISINIGGRKIFKEIYLNR